MTRSGYGYCRQVVYFETMMRILIVDDAKIVRASLRGLLADQVEICGEAENGKQAIDLVRSLHPDVALIDIAMPVMDGLRATVEIRRIAPATKVVLFSIHDGPEAQSVATRVGAQAFVSKSRLAAAVLPTLQKVASDALAN
jgi:DNA-binding NarL/FixJ family response regulator